MDSLEPAVRDIVTQVLQTTWAKAPIMMERMISTMYRYGGSVAALPRLLEALDQRIAIESSPDFKPPILLSSPQILPDFRNQMQWEAFPATYAQLTAGVRDPALITECLIRVWKDFLIRWSATFEKFEDFHFEHLRELCERTIEQANAGQLGNSKVRAATDNLTGVQLRRLAGEVLVSVEQDLRAVPIATEVVPLSIAGRTRAIA